MRKEKAVVWGTGSSGKRAYYKLKDMYEIQGFADSDSKKWGEKFMGRPVLGFEELKNAKEGFILVIASVYHSEILKTIGRLGLRMPVLRISSKSGLLLSVQNACPIQGKRKLRRILYVQPSECIRTHKIAKVMRDAGICVDMAYSHESPELDKKGDVPYERLIPIHTLQGFVDYVNAEDYDIVHCSNWPDALSNLMIFNSNKKVVHDTHDLYSRRKDFTMDEMVAEYNANRHADGLCYATEDERDAADQRHNIQGKPVLILDNYISEKVMPAACLPKLSGTDHEMHCVYEGGVWADKNTPRYFEDIFSRIAAEGVHVHFYSKGNEKYFREIEQKSSYIHYEGYLQQDLLIAEMTKYDIGLLYFNVTSENRDFLAGSAPNKIYEYVSAQLPVAVCDIETLVKKANKLSIGRQMSLDGNIKKQLEDIRNIKIEKDFLAKRGLTMEAQAGRILSFYEEVLNRP